MIELAHRKQDPRPLQRAEREVKQLKRDLARAKKRVSLMEQSTSWKFTAPLRWFTSLFKRSS